MDTAAAVIANLDAGQIAAAAFLAGSLWLGMCVLIVKVLHGGAKSDQIPQQHFAAQAAVRTAEQITAQAATDKSEPKKVLTGA